jgi:hypothetical protein
VISAAQETHELIAPLVEFVIAEGANHVACVVGCRKIRAGAVSETVEKADRGLILQQRGVRRRCAGLITCVNDEGPLRRCGRCLQVRRQHRRAAHLTSVDRSRRKLAVKIVQAEELHAHVRGCCGFRLRPRCDARRELAGGPLVRSASEGEASGSHWQAD